MLVCIKYPGIGLGYVSSFSPVRLCVFNSVMGAYWYIGLTEKSFKLAHNKHMDPQQWTPKYTY